MSTVSFSAAGADEATRSESTLRRFLRGLPGIDQVAAEARAEVPDVSGMLWALATKTVWRPIGL